MRCMTPWIVIFAMAGPGPIGVHADEPQADVPPAGRPRMTMMEASDADPLATVERAARRQAASARKPRNAAPAAKAAGPLARDVSKAARQAAVVRGVRFLIAAQQGKDRGWGREAGRDDRSDVASASIAGLALLKARPGDDVPERVGRERQAAAFVARLVAESKLPALWQPAVVDQTVINDLGTSADAALATLFLAEHVADDAGDDATECRAAVGLLLRHFDRRLQDEPGGFQKRAQGLSRAVLAHAAVVAERAEVPVPEGLMGRLMDGCPAGPDLFGRAARIGCLHAAGLQAGDRPTAETIDLADAAVRPLLSDYHGRWPYGAGGEVFLSLLFLGAMLGDAGGPTAAEWSRGVESQLVQAQNGDGSWTGSSCINSRVFCTSTALLVMHAAPAADRVAAR